MLRALTIIPETHLDIHAIVDVIELTYDDRYRRRLVLQSSKGTRFLLDLARPQILQNGDGLKLEDGSVIKIRAALEDMAEIRCATPEHLTAMAWHLGNRHLPCEIYEDRLIIRWDPVIAAMLEKLGCEVTRFKAPFNPEGGAYQQSHNDRHNHA